MLLLNTLCLVSLALPVSANTCQAPVSTAEQSQPGAALNLLELAFQAGARMPSQPHARNRSKLQGGVVDACFQLGLSEQAVRYAEQIGDWRKGLGYASAAVHWAEKGQSAQAQRFVRQAQSFLDQAATQESTADWQRDRIRARVARALILLGERAAAAEFEANLAASETAPVQAAKGRQLSVEELMQKLKGVDEVVQAGGFEEIQNTLQACAELFEQFYAQPQARDSIQAKITSSWAKLPLQVRVEILIRMGEAALRCRDQAKTLELVSLAQEQFQVGQWLPESEVAFIGALAKLRARAGDVERARKELEAGIAKYNAAEERIVNIYRASALRPIAEAWVAVGKLTEAAKIYSRALEAGQQNPNSRPRADDLAATACSMAVVGFEPDEALWSRMREIEKGLNDPW